VAVSAERRTLDQLLEAAYARIERLTPAEALAATERGALLIDIRTDADRERDGIVPGSLHIPRTVLEWRLDPDSSWRNPHVGGLDRQILLLCDHGCSSSLAAGTLVDLGFERAGDVIGGFAAWREALLQTAAAPPSQRQPGEPAGMGQPDR
jgi:rhodanese-related sulfurtransferase